MGFQREEAIILKIVPYLNQKKIVTFFTPSEGILCGAVRGKREIKMLSVFTKMEIVYHRKSPSQEIVTIKDLSFLEDYEELRKNWDTFSSAAEIVKSLLHSQLPGKKSDRLYLLFSIYLKNLSKAPQVFLRSFQIKLLKHEGLLHIKDTCHHCSRPSVAIQLGESVCSSHKNTFFLSFSPTDFQTLINLAYEKTIASIASIALSQHCEKQIEILFKTLTS